ncbi:PDZ domain-containing protein 8-like [Ruditapes philippinarum]|uniref:PDZ domain-containing protein 8-like n=1 Tax=Ruditapes philippinarum TaxID=129788 RepID=UPI00295C1E22|nr:PDZ domain-containing protein 8-like [Ruditapes philippinarum]
MEFNVDSRFNGRPIPQISSLIVNQIKRTIRKKHVLPSYKMRYKPLFVKPEESFINPDICFHGHKLGPGKLSVKVLKCSRLQELSSECKLYCTLSVDKEEIEEVWKQSWVTLEMTMKILPNSVLGLNLKDQLSGDKTEKKRVVVDSIILDSPAAEAGLQRGDIVETIGNVRVLSIKHAMKQLKNSTENVIIRVKRHTSLALDRGLYIDQQDDIEIEESDMNGELQDDIGDFVSIDFKNKRSSSLNTDIQPSQPNQESVKFSEKLTKKIQSGKKKILGLKDNDKDKESVNKDRDSDTRSLTTDEESAGDKNVSESISTPNHLRDGSQSAKSSPQKQVIEINRQRAHSDTSLNKVQLGDGDTGSACSDAGSYSKPELQHRIGEVNTRDVPFSPDPEWNEEFEFDCKEEDQYVNVCVWCKIAQTERASKNMSTTNKTEGQQQKNTPPTDDLPSYNVTTKIGYVSVPLSDITAGCLLTIQGDTQYTMYLHPPEETITASRTKLPYSGHIGYDKSICHGDITLSFVHKPFKTVEPNVRKETVKDVLNPPIHKLRAQSLEREQLDGQHRFRSCQFTSKTICHFCGKKIWLKGGLKCTLCRMVCHKKCVEKCNVQTKCSRDGPKMSAKPEEAWVPPLKGQDMEKEEGKSMGKFWKFRQKEQPSLPLNIPQRNIPNRAQASPNRSPLRSPSPFASLTEQVDKHFNVSGLTKNLSNKSLSAMERDDDSDDEGRYRNPTYSLDDNVVIEAKEKGKELYANLSLPDRKKTLDDMVTKLQDTIDKESEYKSELMKNYQEITDPDQRRLMSQQLEKCDEKIEALMMMMVHYCAGLQHCLDQEEAHKRLINMEPANDFDDDVITEDAGIQFIVTDT